MVSVLLVDVKKLNEEFFCTQGYDANKDPVLYPIFQEMTPFPARRQEVMNLSPQQTSMEMDICECTDVENPDTAKCLAKAS